MSFTDLGTPAKAKLTPADLVCTKPDEAFLWRREGISCTYDHATQTRRWSESERIKKLMMTTGAPTSSTNWDGENDE